MSEGTLASAAQLMFGWRQEGKVGMEAEGKREVEVVVGLVEVVVGLVGVVEVVVEDTTLKE